MRPGPALSSLVPYYSSVNGDNSLLGSGSELAGPVAPLACSANQLLVSARYTSGLLASDLTVTLLVNGVASALTCSAGSTSPGGSRTCSSTTPVAIAAGDILTFGYSQTNLLAVWRVNTGLRCN